MKTHPSSKSPASPAGLLRRGAALIYDTLLLAATLFVATALVLPFNGGEALHPRHWSYSIYLLAIAAVFFGWFWTHGGQTLGMKAWNIRLCTNDGGALNWSTAALRLLAATMSLLLAGLGYFWILVDPDKRAWHDRLSGTRVVLAKNAPPSPQATAKRGRS